MILPVLGATEKTTYEQGTTSSREPDIMTYYDGIDATSNASYFTQIISSSMTGEQFKTQLQEEFNEMIASVEIYGGFYIGRYETGNLVSNTSTEPVIIKGNENISNVGWYYMYENSKKIAANNNVKTTMIWGSMWDRTLIWLVETGDKTYREIDLNSTTWGNYSNSSENAEEGSGQKRPTGYSEYWKANNIYDLAGNVRDWSLEVYDMRNHSIRGGSYDDSGYTGSASPASVRHTYGPPYYTSEKYGLRSALYISLDI